MEQLTQMELLQVRELHGIESLAIKKCLVYARESQDSQLKELFQDAASLHQDQADNLISQLRTHSGKPQPDAEH